MGGGGGGTPGGGGGGGGGGGVTLVLGLPNKRVTLALAHFFIFHTTCIQGR